MADSARELLNKPKNMLKIANKRINVVQDNYRPQKKLTRTNTNKFFLYQKNNNEAEVFQKITQSLAKLEKDLGGFLVISKVNAVHFTGQTDEWIVKSKFKDFLRNARSELNLFQSETQSST